MSCLGNRPLRYATQFCGRRLDSPKKAGCRHGFTLVELVVVVLILGILAGVAAPSLFETTTAAQASAELRNARVILDAVSCYKAYNGEFPETQDREYSQLTLATICEGAFSHSLAHLGAGTIGMAHLHMPVRKGRSSCSQREPSPLHFESIPFWKKPTTARRPD